MEASAYKEFIFGMLFLKYASDQFDAERERVIADPGAAEAAQAAWKLARARGVAGVLVLHRLSDLDAVGPAGSRERAIAHGLVADSETRVLFGSEPREADALAAVCGLSDREVARVIGLPRGCALWRAGRRPSTPVRHRVPDALLPLVDTDGAMRGQA
jgi:HsdM N-terminal domain